ncbi:hypothetical protein L6V77_20010 [Myxococcota bacterium]|nr:hypothetical protein [Myxococcota bacterium]
MKNRVLVVLAATALSVAGLAVTAATAAAAEPVKAWQGSRTVVKSKHLSPAMKASGDYWDKYTFNAKFPNGSFYFSYAIGDAITDAKKMESKGRLTIDKNTWSWRNDFKEGQWSHVGGEPMSITAGKASMSGTPQSLLFKGETDGAVFELTFTPIANAWRPKAGQVQFGTENKAYDVTLFPHMKVTGRYKAAGADWVDVEGTGYGSHVWGELAPYDMNRWTLDFHAHTGDYNLYMRELGTTDTYGQQRIPYLLITKGNQVLVESFDYTMTPTDVFTDEAHENKYKVPVSFQLQGRDSDPAGPQFRAVVKKKKLDKRKDYLAEMGAVKAAVAGRMAKPVLYDYDVDFTFEVKTASGVEQIRTGAEDGVLEINWLNQ